MSICNSLAWNCVGYQHEMVKSAPVHSNLTYSHSLKFSPIVKNPFLPKGFSILILC